MTTLTADRPIPPVAELRKRLRQVRRRHSTRSMGELMTDVYLVGFIVILYGGSAVVSLHRHLAQRFAGPIGLESTRAWLMIALLIVVGTLAWRGLRALGPLLTTPAALSWCLSTPIDRASWLRTPMWWVLSVSAVIGAVVGALAGWAGFGAAELTWSVPTGAGAGIALAGAAVVAQSRTVPLRSRLRASDAILAAGVALIAVALATRLAGVHTGPPGVPGPIWLILAVALAAVSIWYAVKAVPRVDRAALTGGAQIGTAAVTAAVMMDPTLLTGLIEARRWSRPGKVHSVRLRSGSRDWVLFQADVVRQLRRRANLFTWAALVLAPYAVAAFAPAAASSTRILAGYFAAERLASGLRLVSRNVALRRVLGGTDSELKRAHLAVPALGLVVWWGLTSWSVTATTPLILLIILVGGLLGAVYRTATRPPMSYDAGLSDTPMGPVPTLLLRRLLRGPDLVAVLVLIDLFL